MDIFCYNFLKNQILSLVGQTKIIHPLLIEDKVVNSVRLDARLGYTWDWHDNYKYRAEKGMFFPKVSDFIGQNKNL